MHKISNTLILTLVCSLVYGQTYMAVQLADSLLKAGNFKAAITTYDFPEEIKVLQTKALVALKNDPQWADKYLVVRVERGDKDLKYLSAYDLTKEEFEKMSNGFTEGQVPIYTDTSLVSIIKNKSLITFKCSKKLSLFNSLKIDTKNNAIYFDNLKVTRELAIDGKSYAPILKGIECHMSKEIKSLKHQTDITYFGLTIGTNTSDLKTTLCLIYGKSDNSQVISQPQFLIMTIL